MVHSLRFRISLGFQPTHLHSRRLFRWMGFKKRDLKEGSSEQVDHFIVHVVTFSP